MIFFHELFASIAIYFHISICFKSLGKWKYTEHTKSWCGPKIKGGGTYYSLYEAKKACSVNDECGKFYDSKGRGIYSLCRYSGSTQYSKTGSILYTKQPGKFIIIKNVQNNHLIEKNIT